MSHSLYDQIDAAFLNLCRLDPTSWYWLSWPDGTLPIFIVGLTLPKGTVGRFLPLHLLGKEIDMQRVFTLPPDTRLDTDGVMQVMSTREGTDLHHQLEAVLECLYAIGNTIKEL